jgi:NhaP-type Na+/H+ or K+/H+ antiporter
MAVAGLIVGNQGFSFAMSDQTKDYVVKFWALIDEVLNAVLFLLIGLEAVVLAQRFGLLGLGILTVPLVLGARALSVGVLLLFWRSLLPFGLAFPVMTWGGLRGGISIALALSLPQWEHEGCSGGRDLCRGAVFSARPRWHHRTSRQALVGQGLFGVAGGGTVKPAAG